MSAREQVGPNLWEHLHFGNELAFEERAREEEHTLSSSSRMRSSRVLSMYIRRVALTSLIPPVLGGDEGSSWERGRP
jgi:hypothetical protein